MTAGNPYEIVAHRSVLTGALHEGQSGECWTCRANMKSRPGRCRPPVDLVVAPPYFVPRCDQEPCEDLYSPAWNVRCILERGHPGHHASQGPDSTLLWEAE